jgi:hypothetical protein
MNKDETTATVREIMLDFAASTGLEPVGARPKRYLWTDAFAVCNYLELFHRTGDETYRNLSLRLVGQVHHTLGRHRDDDPRRGWISGLAEQEGEAHPTGGGLRIGKPLGERRSGEPFDERLEWDRDGQYYHYLTKWMHALNRVASDTGAPTYLRWAMDLAQTAHAAFTYTPPSGGRKRLYWKMGIDLGRPLVPAMGQHDPLDGFVTYSELQVAAGNFGGSVGIDLSAEIADMAGICRGLRLATADPLGIGGLLFDASRIAQVTIREDLQLQGLLESVLDSALAGLESFAGGEPFELPAEHRLAFRELGLAIGLAGVEMLPEWIEEHPDRFGPPPSLERQAKALLEYLPLKTRIDRFWMDGTNREARTWTDHREINMVMLATSLAPGEFLRV